MLTRLLGGTDLRPSTLGFGCSRIASLSAAATPAEIEATLNEAFDAGINFFDTADVYGQGDAERLLGRVFRSRRNRILICTKAGLTVGPVQDVVRMVKPLVRPLLRRWGSARSASLAARDGVEGRCFEPAYLRKHLEGSLQRLRIDQVDLFLLHSPRPDIPQRSDALEMLRLLRQQGKLRYFGVSCATLEDAGSWLAEPDISCVQLPVSRVTLTQASPALQQAAARNIGVVAREVFQRGALLQVGRPELALEPLVKRSDIGVLLLGMSSRLHLRANLTALRRAQSAGFAPDTAQAR